MYFYQLRPSKADRRDHYCVYFNSNSSISMCWDFNSCSPCIAHASSMSMGCKIGHRSKPQWPPTMNAFFVRSPQERRNNIHGTLRISFYSSFGRLRSFESSASPVPSRLSNSHRTRPNHRNRVSLVANLTSLLLMRGDNGASTRPDGVSSGSLHVSSVCSMGDKKS